MAVAKNITVLANGHNLATALTSFVPTADSDELGATVLASDGGFREYVQSFKSAELALTGIFDSDTTNLDKIHDVLSAAYNSGDVMIVTGSLGAISLGAPALMMDGVQMNYAVPVNVGELIFSNATLKSQNGLNFGNWLMSQAIAAGSVNGASLDNGAATAKGGVFHAHLENDDATDVDVKLQHSTNNSVWVDVVGGAINDLSDPHAAGSVTVAGTINRYIRAVATVAGGDAILVSAAFARR